MKELEILGSVKSAQEVPEEILWRSTVSRFWDRIKNQDQKELEAVGNKNLFRILEDNMIVGHAPAGGVVLERLGNNSARITSVRTHTQTYRVEKRAEKR